MFLAVAFQTVSYTEIGKNNTKKEIHMIHTKFPISKNDDTVQMIQLHCFRANYT